jgi:hypothetical protein
MIYNMNRSEKSPDIPVEDFMPKFGHKEEVEEDADLTDMEAMALALGAMVVSK